MAVPDSNLEEVMDLYNKALKEHTLEFVIFGHIGNNHVHVNILPNSMAEYNKGKELYTTWAEKVVKMGGTVSAEHGIGKLKIVMLKKMMGENGIQEMKNLKNLFDPENRLNKGNLFE
jgi:D-lactate dehydrogenase (cytochrome)